MPTEYELDEYEERRPRVSFDVTEEQKAKLGQIPWGIRGRLLRALLDDLFDLVEANGGRAIGAVIEKRFHLSEKYKD